MGSRCRFMSGRCRGMTFEEVKEFLTNKMKLSNIYQPLLIKSLLEFGDTSTIRQMALAFLSQDESFTMI